MTEHTPEHTPAAPETQTPPPWGDNFDPARAWNTIQTLREAEKERNSLRGQVNELRPQAEQFRALEEASKSEAQRLAEQAETARRDAESARAEATRYKAAATYGIGSDHFDLLGSGTEEEISARAAKLQTLLAAQAAVAQQTQPVTPPATRPVEQLRPGATPAGAESEDDVILAKLFGPPQQ